MQEEHMSAFRKIGVYLGLAEEDDYADGAEYAPVNGYSEPQHYGRREVVDRRDLDPRREVEVGSTRTMAYDQHPAEHYPAEHYDSGQYPPGQYDERDGAYEQHPSRQRITTLHPRTYNEAKTIGLQFRGGTPVIMNLSEMDDSDAKRLVDFAAGLTFGLHGSIERVTPKVFLLSPKNITVTAADKARIAEGGFYNQS
jgi:cell division inhibitor SepF